MIRLDRSPKTYDQIFKFKIPHCSERDCTVSNLLYQQMYQHERVCQKDIDATLDPVKVELLPFFHPEGDKFSLIDTQKLTSFYNSPVEVESTVDTNIKLGNGFRVCLLQHTNQIFIVGGEGSENKTFLFNSESNLIEETSWDLTYPRIGHSLCSAENTLICTGSKAEDCGSFEASKKVEIFK